LIPAVLRILILLKSLLAKAAEVVEDEAVLELRLIPLLLLIFGFKFYTFSLLLIGILIRLLLLFEILF